MSILIYDLKLCQWDYYGILTCESKYLSVLSLISGKQGNVQVENKTPNRAVLLWTEAQDHGKGFYLWA